MRAVFTFLNAVGVTRVEREAEIEDDVVYFRFGSEPGVLLESGDSVHIEFGPVTLSVD